MQKTESTQRANSIKIKVWGHDEALILEALQAIRDRFPGLCTVSRLLESDQGGWHAYATIFKEA